jgi:hypothetical protein
MSIELIDKIKPANGNSFALVDAEDVEFEDGKRLDEKLNEIAASGGGGSVDLSGYAKKEDLNDYEKTEAVDEKLGGKVDKEDGKGLSTNDYTEADKAKVDKIKTDGDANKFLNEQGEYVEVEGGGSGGGQDINLKNGEGFGSVVMKTGDDAEVDYINTATGEGATAIGNGNEASCKKSYAFGTQNKVSNNSCGAFGTLNKVLKPASVAIGYNNTLDSDRGFTAGFNNNASGNAVIVLGNDNTTNKDKAVAIGTNNTVTFDSGCAIGNYHTVNAMGVAMGLKNTINAHYGVAINSANTIGQNATNSFVGGQNSVVNAYKAFGFGEAVIVNTPAGAAFGSYNKGDSGNAFEIGRGDSNNRRNIFEVTTSGIARAYGTPKDDYDLIRKKDLTAFEKVPRHIIYKPITLKQAVACVKYSFSVLGSFEIEELSSSLGGAVTVSIRINPKTATAELIVGNKTSTIYFGGMTKTENTRYYEYPVSFDNYPVLLTSTKAIPLRPIEEKGDNFNMTLDYYATDGLLTINTITIELPQSALEGTYLYQDFEIYADNATHSPTKQKSLYVYNTEDFIKNTTENTLTLSNNITILGYENIV